MLLLSYLLSKLLFIQSRDSRIFCWCRLHGSRYWCSKFRSSFIRTSRRYWNPHYEYQEQQHACNGDTCFPYVSLEPAHTQNLHSTIIEQSRKRALLQDITSNRSMSKPGAERVEAGQMPLFSLDGRARFVFHALVLPVLPFTNRVCFCRSEERP